MYTHCLIFIIMIIVFQTSFSMLGSNFLEESFTYWHYTPANWCLSVFQLNITWQNNHSFSTRYFFIPQLWKHISAKETKSSRQTEGAYQHHQFCECVPLISNTISRHSTLSGISHFDQTSKPLLLIFFWCSFKATRCLLR